MKDKRTTPDLLWQLTACYILPKKYLKTLKDNKHNGLHLAVKICTICPCKLLLSFPFHKARSFPRDTLSEKLPAFVTDNVQGQVLVHIFTANGGHCLFKYWQMVGSAIFSIYISSYFQTTPNVISFTVLALSVSRMEYIPFLINKIYKN